MSWGGCAPPDESSRWGVLCKEIYYDLKRVGPTRSQPKQLCQWAGVDGAFCTHLDLRDRSSYEPAVLMYYKLYQGQIYGPLTSPLRPLHKARQVRPGTSTADPRVHAARRHSEALSVQERRATTCAMHLQRKSNVIPWFLTVCRAKPKCRRAAIHFSARAGIRPPAIPNRHMGV